MILDKNLKLFYRLYLDKISLEKMFGDIWVENRPFQSIKKSILHGHQIGFFLRG